tara:strand:- start:454 stop:663 length:210 start_codon:yes stop_codon:yes gene_type:complete
MDEFLNQVRAGASIKILALGLEHFYSPTWDMERVKRTFEGYRGNKTYYKVLRETSDEFQERFKNERKVQ